MSDVTPGATSRRVLLTTAGAVGAGALLAACGSESPTATPSNAAPGAAPRPVRRRPARAVARCWPRPRTSRSAAA
ncbi:hypothetical protein ACFQY4_10060 [Catellatospora bangladeshensis]|uniref:hypothetical protein n=1 Tax=Catellatospora bangladeshensis TaxID=310355 RepID=UPI00361718C5